MNGVVESNAKFYNSCVQTQVCWSPNVNAAFMCHSLWHSMCHNSVTMSVLEILDLTNCILLLWQG